MASQPLSPAAWVLIRPILAYRAIIGPLRRHRGVYCMYQPSCSRYALDAIRQHGAIRGLWLIFWRLQRCSRHYEAGIYDPVPRSGKPRDHAGVRLETPAPANRHQQLVLLALALGTVINIIITLRNRRAHRQPF